MNAELQTGLPGETGGRREMLGRRLAKAREAAGLSQRDAAERSEQSQATVSRAESGSEVSEESLRVLYGAYGLPVPPGPIDPLRRIDWVAARSALMDGAKAPASGTYGKPAKKS